MLKTIFSLSLLALCCLTEVRGERYPTRIDSSGVWVLVSKTATLAVYRRASAKSAIDEIRITAVFKTTMENFLRVLGDVPGYQKWVYKCGEARQLSASAVGEQIYYVRSIFPWPLQDRDLIVHSVVKKDAATGVVTSTSRALPDHRPVVDGVVRMRQFSSTWKITPEANGTVAVDYRVTCDPGGILPDWAVNLGITSGPRKTMEGLAKLVEGK